MIETSGKYEQTSSSLVKSAEPTELVEPVEEAPFAAAPSIISIDNNNVFDNALSKLVSEPVYS
ncbi:MAG: hypothetical protein LBD81_02580 [Holosporaceae bacterium]|nr:hypothetical protein [Holosporaceae bacterium]